MTWIDHVRRIGLRIQIEVTVMIILVTGICTHDYGCGSFDSIYFFGSVKTINIVAITDKVVEKTALSGRQVVRRTVEEFDRGFPLREFFL